MTERKTRRWWPDHAPEVYDALLELCGTLSTETLDAMTRDMEGWKGELSDMARDAIQERKKGRTP